MTENDTYEFELGNGDLYGEARYFATFCCESEDVKPVGGCPHYTDTVSRLDVETLDLEVVEAFDSEDNPVTLTAHELGQVEEKLIAYLEDMVNDPENHW